MTSQTYNLDGPKEFPFPHPVRSADQLTVEIVPGAAVAPGDYEVVGVGPTSTQVTVRYPNAPTSGGLQLKITRYVAPERVTQIDSPSDINVTNLNAEFNNVYEAMTDLEATVLQQVQDMLDDFQTNVLDPAVATTLEARDEAVDARNAAQAAETGATEKWDAFRDQYWGAYASDPSTSPLGNPPDEGDLYWNTTAKQWRVWNGSAWQQPDTAVPVNYDRRDYIATASQTTFAVDYDAPFVQVWVNGALIPPSDYTATSGTSVVLAEGVPEDTEVTVIGLGATTIDVLDGDAAQVSTSTGTQLLPAALDDRVVHVPDIAALRALTGVHDGQIVNTPFGEVRWDESNQMFIPRTLDAETASFSVSDAIWSWWAKPCMVRHVGEATDRTLISFSTASGAVGVAEFDRFRKTVKTKIISKDFDPDDHNTGAIVVGDGQLAAFFPGRRYQAGSSQNVWYSVSNDGTIDGLSGLETSGNVLKDYPNVYNVDSEVIIFGRRNQTGDSGPGGQWGIQTGSWPLGTWDEPASFFQSAYTWPYMSTRRSTGDVRSINIALGWHPDNEDHADIYMGAIRREEASGEWIFSSLNGSANITTGANLPLSENDFELAYSAAQGERTRLFDVHDDCFVFCSFENLEDGGVYKHARREGSGWVVTDICDSGQPFYLSYFGGVSIDDRDKSVVFVSRESGGDWLIEKYQLNNTGDSFVFLEILEKGTVQDGDRKVVARPMSEVLAPESYGLVDGPLTTAYFRGAYSEVSYDNFSTSITSSEGSLLISTPGGEASQSKVISSGGSTAAGFRNVVAASRLSDVSGQSAFISSGNESSVNRPFSSVMASLACTVEDSITSGNGWYGLIAASVSSHIRESNGSRSLILASGGSEVQGNGAAQCIIGCDGVVTTGSSANMLALASTDSVVSASRGGIIGCRDSAADRPGVVLLGAYGVAPQSNHIVAGGYGEGGPSTSNRTWQFGSVSGNLQISGSLTEGVDFSDIAKMLKNGEGQEIPPGYLLTLIGDSVYKTQEGERVDAIVAATPGVIQNDTPFCWQGRYVKDEWGLRLMEDVAWVSFDGYEGPLSKAPEPVPEDASHYILSVPVENPDYIPEAEQIPRSERPDEWVKAGIHGVLRTRVDATVTQAGVDAAATSRSSLFIEPSSSPGVGRRASAETNVQVLSVEKEFDGNYGIACCLLR